MKYKLNFEELTKGGTFNDWELAEKAFRACRAILIFFEVGKFFIDEKLYLELSDNAKQFFVGIEEVK